MSRHFVESVWLEVVTYVFILAFTAFTLSLVWWRPSALIGIGVGLSGFVIGISLTGLLVRYRRSL